MPDTLTITDNRTGRTYELPVTDGTIRAADLRRIKTPDDDFGLMTYDPALMNTAAVKSQITYIDGDRGILRYRGYPIEQLAEQSSYLETAYLLLHGELPSGAQLSAWTQVIHEHRVPPDGIERLLDGFPGDPHPMGVLIASFAALSTHYPESKAIFDETTRRTQIHRLIAQAPALAAYTSRHRRGLPIVRPADDLSFTGNFLAMLFSEPGRPFTPNPVLERALDVLFILHADHEQNCSTFAMRSVGSSHADPFSSRPAPRRRSTGPLHGGANEAVLRMLNEIGSIDQVPEFIARVKAGEGRLMGFGHRVYKSVRPARQDRQTDRRRGVRGDGPQPAARDRDGARTDRAAGRLLRLAQALSERGFLLGAHLPGDGLPHRHVPGALRHPAHIRLAGPVGRDAARSRHRRSCGPARSTPAPTSEPTFRASSGVDTRRAAGVGRGAACSTGRQTKGGGRRPAPPGCRPTATVGTSTPAAARHARVRRGGGGRARRQRLRLQRPAVHSSTFDAARYTGGQDGGRRSVRLEPCVRAPAAARGDRSPARGLTRHRPGATLHHRAAEGGSAWRSPSSRSRPKRRSAQ